jgi:hypothetical protein
MLLVAGILLAWIVAASAAIVLCVAARRGDEELSMPRPTALPAVDGAVSSHTRVG